MPYSDWFRSVNEKMEERQREKVKKDCKNWRSKHKEHYNQYHREYYARRMNDPEFRARRCEYQRKHYAKKKGLTDGN